MVEKAARRIRVTGKATTDAHLIILAAMIGATSAAVAQGGYGTAPEAVRAEISGNTQLHTSTTPVMETRDDAKFQTERYGQDFTYLFHGVPAGRARLKLGFCENRYTRPGERLVDVYVDGKLLLNDFDILTHGSPNEAVVEAWNITVPAGRPLAVRFVAQVDNAKINLIRIYSDSFVLETSPLSEQPAVFSPKQRTLPASEDVWETQLGRLGSRVAINPRPQQGVWWQGPLGHAQYRTAYFDDDEVDFKQKAERYIFGVRAGDVTVSLPFDDRLEHFSKVDQTETMTKLSYECRSPELPVTARFTWFAPLYPGDARLSTAPWLGLEVEVTGADPSPQSGQVLIGRSVPSGEPLEGFSGPGCIGLKRASEVFELPVEEYWCLDGSDLAECRVYETGLPLGDEPPTAPRTVAQRDGDGRWQLPLVWDQPYGGITWDFSVKPGETKRMRVVYVGWADEAVQTVHGRPHRFKYHQYFANAGQVARYAFDEWDAIARRCELLESTVADATIPQAMKQFLAFATHSYLVNTWWTTSPSGEDFFTVWEGCCQLQSTVDVEYNIAPLYFALWPELLRMQFDQWAEFVHDGVLDHDIGFGLEVGRMAYWHPMEVEENTNYVLLLHHYWTQTGDETPVRDHFETVRELLEYVTTTDTDGDGFSEEGLYNTIDQGSAAIQYATDQVYLAVRAIAAYSAGAEMAELGDDAATAARWRERAALTARTLDEQGWLEDHYVVALNQPPAQDDQRAPEMMDEGGYQDQWQGNTQQSAPLTGWDSYSIYTANGLVYPMRSGMKIAGLNVARLRTDLRRATAETMDGYGSPHTSHESNMWVSQNIWRDIAAAYLGIDYIDNIDRYWAVQKHINTVKYGAFTDVYVYGSGSTSLDYYPRGVAAFGLYNALAGLQIDLPRGVISVAPLRTPLRLPLTGLAKWHEGTVPWLIIEGEGDEITARVEGGELPKGITLTVRERGEGL